MDWLLVSLRRFRVERATVIGLLLLVFATAFVFGVAPRILEGVADDALQTAITQASSAGRNIELVQQRRVDPGPDDPMGGIRVVGASLEGQLPDEIRRLVVGRAMVVETSRWGFGEPTPTIAAAYLRFQPEADEHLRLVEGTWPTGPAGPTEPGEPALVFEGAVSTTSAEVIGASVGDVFRLSLDPSDRRNDGHVAGLEVRIAGIFEMPEPDEEFWLGEVWLDQPRSRPLGDDVSSDVTILLPTEAYPAFIEATRPDGTVVETTWRYFVDPARFDDARAEDLLSDLRRVESVFSGTAAVVADATAFRSGLLGVVESEQAAWRSAESVLAVVAAGPAAVAFAALALVALLVARRRRPTVTLWLDRGASSVHVAAAAIGEGFVLAIPAALAGGLLAAVVVPSGSNRPTLGMALAVGAATTIAFTVAMLLVGGTGQRAERDAGVASRRSTRRTVFEVLVVALAIGGAWLLRERGVEGASAAGEIGSADPLIAFVPVLLGLAAGIVMIRLYPIVMRAAAAAAAAGTGLVPVHAMRRATRSGGGAAILLVLLLTAAIGSFASAVLVHLDRAGDAVAWHAVGAPYRISRDDAPLPSRLVPDDLPADATAAATRATVPLGLRGIPVPLLAVESTAYAAVAAGTPADPAFPAGFTGPGPVPAIVGPGIVEELDGGVVGDTFNLGVEGRAVEFVVAEVRESFPTMPIDGAFVVADRDRVQEAVGRRRLTRTDLFIRAPEPSPTLVEAIGSAPGVVFDSRLDRSVSLGDAPIVSAVTTGVAAAVLVATAYAALAVAAALALTGSARAPESALLRVLGLGGRQQVGLAGTEYGPLVLVAFGIGAVLGLGLFVVLRPGLGLESIVGSPVTVPLAVDVGQLLLLGGAIVLVLSLAMAISIVLQRAADPATTIRRGIE
jgi:putative ABC transport system permease protein